MKTFAILNVQDLKRLNLLFLKYSLKGKFISTKKQTIGYIFNQDQYAIWSTFLNKEEPETSIIWFSSINR